MPRPNRLREWKNPEKVFITGASSGIGASYAKALAEIGFDLVLLARRKDRLQALAKLLESDFSINCEIITADLSEKEDIKKAANYIRQIDNLDILIFEFLEHVLIPLFWLIKNRGKHPKFGVPGMIGKSVRVRKWKKTEGLVLINGEF